MDAKITYMCKNSKLVPAEQYEPLIKWPGGKRKLLKHILPLIPTNIERYYEPFMGGGALFFALQPQIPILSDSNEDLMNFYIQIRDHPEEIISLLSVLKNTKEDYYLMRESNPKDAVEQAVRFIYLMKLAFNGVHRVNANGHFNVPYGYNKDTTLCNSDKIRAVSSLLSSASLSYNDFKVSVKDAKKGDFIYFDPPYTVAHGNNGFIKYNARIFSWNDQVRLANTAHNLVERGCKVIVSNADHPSIQALYTNFKSEVVMRGSTIAASSSHRRQITECLFYN